MTQQLATLRVMSDEFFQNSFSEGEIAISTLQLSYWIFEDEMFFHVILRFALNIHIYVFWCLGKIELRDTITYFLLG